MNAHEFGFCMYSLLVLATIALLYLVGIYYRLGKIQQSIDRFLWKKELEQEKLRRLWESSGRVKT